MTLIDRDDVAAVAAETGVGAHPGRHPAQPGDDGHRPARAGRTVVHRRRRAAVRDEALPALHAPGAADRRAAGEGDGAPRRASTPRCSRAGAIAEGLRAAGRRTDAARRGAPTGRTGRVPGGRGAGGQGRAASTRSNRPLVQSLRQLVERVGPRRRGARAGRHEHPQEQVDQSAPPARVRRKRPPIRLSMPVCSARPRTPPPSCRLLRGGGGRTAGGRGRAGRLRSVARSRGCSGGGGRHGAAWRGGARATRRKARSAGIASGRGRQAAGSSPKRARTSFSSGVIRRGRFSAKSNGTSTVCRWRRAARGRRPRSGRGRTPRARRRPRSGSPAARRRRRPAACR